MASAITTCEKCSTQFEWNTDSSSGMPDCPKCGHNPKRVFQNSETEGLVRLLQTGDRYQSSGAAAELGNRGDKDAVPALIAAIRDPAAGTAAIIALGKLRDERAVEPLAEYVRSGGQVKADAVAALFSIRTPAALDAAFELLYSCDAHEVVQSLHRSNKLDSAWLLKMLDMGAGPRQAAAWQLARKPSRFAIPQLVVAMSDPNSSTARSAAQALSAVDWEPTTLDEMIAFFTLTKNWDKIKSLGESVIEKLMNEIQSSTEPQLLAQTLIGIGWHRTASSHGVRAIPVLDVILTFDKLGYPQFDTGERYTAIHELGKIGVPACIPVLLKATQDDNERNALEAIELLEPFGTTVVEPLIELLNKKPQIVWRVAEALAKIGDPRAIEPLIEKLNTSEQVNRGIVRALGTFRDRRAIQPLIRSLSRKDCPVDTIATTLVQFGNPQAVEPLIALLSQNEHAILPVANALAQLGDARAVEPLMRVVNDGVPSNAQNASEKLGRNQLCRCNANRYAPVCCALRRAGYEECIPTCKKGNKYRACCELYIRNKCADAVEKLTGKRPVVKQGCFIATAAMGDVNHPDVVRLQRFRDEYLEQRMWGQHFVAYYYQYSPAIAELIQRVPVLKPLVRWLVVTPVAIVSRWFILRN